MTGGFVEGWRVKSPSELVQRLAERLVEEEFPLSRLLCLIRALHPQVIDISYTWRRNTGATEICPTEFSPDALQKEPHIGGPIGSILDGTVEAIRQRLDVSDIDFDCPALAELRAQGGTDYIAAPLTFSDRQINVVTFEPFPCVGLLVDIGMVLACQLPVGALDFVL